MLKLCMFLLNFPVNRIICVVVCALTITRVFNSIYMTRYSLLSGGGLGFILLQNEELVY